jgi:hypothetical protein
MHSLIVEEVDEIDSGLFSGLRDTAVDVVDHAVSRRELPLFH